MPKPQKAWFASRYTALTEIADDEWDEAFFASGTPWEEEDNDYLREYYGKEDTLTVCYALGRPPWSVYAQAVRLGLHSPLRYKKKPKGLCECGRLVYAKGLCQYHYNKRRKEERRGRPSDQ